MLQDARLGAEQVAQHPVLREGVRQDGGELLTALDRRGAGGDRDGGDGSAVPVEEGCGNAMAPPVYPAGAPERPKSRSVESPEALHRLRSGEGGNPLGELLLHRRG
ncbi:hypothetical protein GCM10010245_65830 [Streptomyces spectabilis]|uniref:Uncharacterized protein n=1 Tax=Streptomyces spectabilis TaxID=68270 RepID=A0A7W8B334_STRST|nr:hypothetical protein [Streptomyces spectabilis]GGV41943.1 hypothetical protein GCM10010245_65830 [Streptomyces spectabilis]